MAIYHVSVSVGSIGKGSVRHLEGRLSGARRQVPRGRGAAGAGPGASPRRARQSPGGGRDGRAYWQAVDAGERSNGTLYRQVEFALPVELEEEERIQAAREFARELSNSAGERLPYTLAVHRGEGTNRMRT